jgi:hypothetical protein
MLGSPVIGALEGGAVDNLHLHCKLKIWSVIARRSMTHELTYLWQLSVIRVDGVQKDTENGFSCAGCEFDGEEKRIRALGSGDNVAKIYNNSTPIWKISAGRMEASQIPLYCCKVISPRDILSGYSN